MQYQPNFLEAKSVFSPTEQTYLHQLAQRLPISELLDSQRNIEEIGIDFVHSSAQLEGNTYDKHDTLALFKMGQTAGGKLFSDAVMLLNLRESYHYLWSCLDCDTAPDLKEFIKTTHALIAKDLLPAAEIGTVRQGSVRISGTEYTPLSNPQRLAGELDYLCTTVNKINNPFDKALYLHNNLAYLQFFRDCNKRTARNSMIYTLMRFDIFPCIFISDSYAQYSGGILEYYETGDYRKSAEYFIHAYEQTVSRYEPRDDPVFSRNLPDTHC